MTHFEGKEKRTSDVHVEGFRNLRSIPHVEVGSTLTPQNKHFKDDI